MGKHYPIEFKEKVVSEYKAGTYGGSVKLGKHYGISRKTIDQWIAKDKKQGNQINDVEKKRGKTQETKIEYKERYEILKNYQAFIKAQREKK